MQRINQYNFYEFGGVLHPLSELDRDMGELDVLLTVEPAQKWLNRILNNELVPLTICKRDAEALRQEIETVIDRVSLDSETPTKILGVDIYRLRSALDRFEHVFSSELQSLATYYVSEKGLYSTQSLVDSAEKAFPIKVQAQISDAARDDFRAAGKCLAFDLPTAAAFHIFRSIEAVLRDYLETFVDSDSRPKSRNWGVYIRVLRNCIHSGQQPAPDPKTVSMIEQIKDMHRNPLIHPEAVLEADEALVLFDIGKSAIVAMTLELNALEQSV